MDVSYSAWRQVSEESRVISKDSFSFLFDRRYTNRLNRMSRVFFEAYIKATGEVAAEEDRFPSLSEIESRMESGAIYAYKDRLMRSTEFFNEVKVSGISYLIPRARRFVDETGTYTDLILDFDEGAVVLPKRGPVVISSKPETASEKEAESPEAESEPVAEAEPTAEPESEKVQKQVSEPGSETESKTKPESETKSEAKPEPEDSVPLPEPEPELEVKEAYGGAKALEISEEELKSALEESPEDIPKEQAPTKTPERKKAPEAAKVEPAPKDAAQSAAGRKGIRDLPPEEYPSQIHAEKKTSKKPSAKGPIHSLKVDRRVLLAAVAIIAIVGIFAAHFWIFAPTPETPDPIPQPLPIPLETVQYSAYLSNVTGSTYLNVDITNPFGLENQVEMVIPPDIEKSINVVGGTVGISYTNRTAIQLASRNDANISICLIENFDEVPVTFNLTVPSDFDSDLLVYDEYQSTRKEEHILLKCKCTSEPLRFEQVYLRSEQEDNEKNVSQTSSGPGGAKERRQKNVTEIGRAHV